MSDITFVATEEGWLYQCAIMEYIGIFHIRQRRHLRLGYLSPASFAEEFDRQRLVACNGRAHY